jgi:hypothetical protein
LRASNFRTPARRARFENFRLWSIGGSGGLLPMPGLPPEADIKRKGRHVRWAANRRLIHRSKRYCCRPDTLGPELAAARQKANITKIRGVRQLTDAPRIRHNQTLVGSNRIEKMKTMSDWLSRAAALPARLHSNRRQSDNECARDRRPFSGRVTPVFTRHDFVTTSCRARNQLCCARMPFRRRLTL